MQRLSTPMLLVILLLSALAGYVDAIAFASFGGFFASFMSGNTTQLGLGIGLGPLGAAATAGSLVLGFVSGTMLGTVAGRSRGGETVMLLVTGLLLAAAVCAQWGPRPLALVLLAGAMGAENAVFTAAGGVRVGLTYVTGTLVRVGERLALALMGEGPRMGWSRDLLLWATFLGGAVAGGAVFARVGDAALWFAAALAAALAPLAGRVRE